MEKGEKKTKYLRWLEMLEMELNSIKAVSSGGLKLAFLYVLYDVQRAKEMFAQVRSKMEGNSDIRELLEIDEDVDYSVWAGKLRTFDTKKYFVTDDQEHSHELKNIKRSLWGVADSLVTPPGEKDIDKEEFVRKLEALLWDKVSEEHLRLTLSKHLGELCKELEGIANEMYQRKLTQADDEQLFETLSRSFNWECGKQVMDDWKNWMAEWEDDEDNSVLLRHARGKMYEEMLELFKSGFLNPKLKRQMEADMDDCEGEIRFECFENVPAGIDVRKHYSALRDLVDLKNKCYQPKKAIIGKYIFNNRQTVREEQRRAFFRFLRMMQRLEELKKVNTTENGSMIHNSIANGDKPAKKNAVWKDNLENSIFSSSLFATAEHLQLLHDTISEALEQLKGKNELFWLYAALDDAEVMNFQTRDVAFIKQMQEWFPDSPWLSSSTKKIANAISTERHKWMREGMRVKVTNLRASRQQFAKTMQNTDKIDRFIRIANDGLYKQVMKLKAEIQNKV